MFMDYKINEAIEDFELYYPFVKPKSRLYSVENLGHWLFLFNMRDGSIYEYDLNLHSFRFFEDEEQYLNWCYPTDSKQWRKTFGVRLNRLMLFKGFSQEDLADAIGVSQKTISNYTQGLVAPNMVTIMKMARAMEITQEEFGEFVCYIL